VSAAEPLAEPLVSTTANPDRKAASVDPGAVSDGNAAHGRSHSKMGLLEGAPMISNVCLCGHATDWFDHASKADRALADHEREMRVHPLIRAFHGRDPLNLLFPEKGVARVLRTLADAGRICADCRINTRALADEVEAAGTDNTTRRQ